MILRATPLNPRYHKIATRLGRVRWGIRAWEQSVAAWRPRFSGEYVEGLQSENPNLRFATPLCPTTNIGDEIQNLASLGFVPRKTQVVGVDRENLSAYKGPPAIFIANGWYMFRPETWPPALGLHPVLVSVHIANDAMLVPEKIDYLKRHAPIGCRDTATMAKLRKAGVDCYFSGCLTLTLQNPYRLNPQRSGVVICDADLGWDGGYPPSAGSLMRKLVPPEIIAEAQTRTEHECSPKLRYNFRHKHELAEYCLGIYARARLVITTRLHCALPCLAFGTPMILIHQNYDTESRFDGLREFIKGYGPRSKSIDIDWQDPKPTDISAFRDQIISNTREAVKRKLDETSAQA